MTDDRFDRCVWFREKDSAPLLKTAEGFEYQAVTSKEFFCGSRRIWRIPPGLIVTAMGDTFESAQHLFVSHFEIPEGSTPKTLIVKYETLGSGLLSAVVNLETEYSEPIPFDFNYPIEILSVGDKFSIGEVASLSVESEGTDTNGLVPVSITIINEHKGYPLHMEMSSTSLINQDGVLCCQTIVYQYEGYKDDLGPGQSMTLQNTFENLDHKKVWLIVDVTFIEDSPTEISYTGRFVVELP
jgi:hypothetical protein